MIKVSTFIKILSFFLMGKVYLLIVFESLPFPFSSFYFYSLAWFLCLLFFNTKILISRSLLYVYLFMALFYPLMLIGIYEEDLLSLFQGTIIPLFVALSIGEYYFDREDYKGLGLLIGATIFFIIISAITTSIAVSVNPLAARHIGGELQQTGRYDLIDFYKSMGIASYSFVVGLAFMIPVLIGIAKQKWRRLTLHYLFIIGIIILVFSFTRFQYTMALLFGSFGLIISLVSTRYRVVSTIILATILISLIIMPPSTYLQPLYNLVDYTGSFRLQERIIDFQVFLEVGEIGGTASHAGRKTERIPILLDYIKEKPFLGTGFSSGHNFWLDWTSRYGFIGLLPWILIIYQQIRINLKRFDRDYKYYYLLSMASYIIFGFINNIDGSQMLIMIYLVIPGLYYFKELVILKTENSTYDTYSKLG